eukprot:394624-Pyramimonas_sp.AAC.1
MFGAPPLSTASLACSAQRQLSKRMPPLGGGPSPRLQQAAQDRAALLGQVPSRLAGAPHQLGGSPREHSTDVVDDLRHLRRL